MDIQTLESLTHFDHSQKVALINKLLAQYAGFPENEVHIIEQAALLHDIGKSSIPKEILQKPGKLTVEEYAIVKKHTTLGHRQIEDVAKILVAAEIVAETHHERPDGKGYLGLSGNEIHPYSRIVAIADVFDALYSKRVYKAAWNAKQSEYMQYLKALYGEDVLSDDSPETRTKEINVPIG